MEFGHPALAGHLTRMAGERGEDHADDTDPPLSAPLDAPAFDALRPAGRAAARAGPDRLDQAPPSAPPRFTFGPGARRPAGAPDGMGRRRPRR
ncbi:hypothetical protein GCM10009605_59040 [Nocardiopsis composta]